ncbi:MAG: N-6 DNA methylase, partial [Candidatus Omnitrophota bacterium]
MAEDVASQSNALAASKAFDDYSQSLNPLVKPYLRNGFFNEQKALERFYSETAMLHLAAIAISEWCKILRIGKAEGFWSIYPEARFFSWYKASTTIQDAIQQWVANHSGIEGALQAITLVAEDSLAGLRRRALGEFFTPPEIADHLVELLAYDPLTIFDRKLVDPTCGSGNLLTALVKQVILTVHSASLELDAVITGLNQNVYGFDIQPIAVLLTRLQLFVTALPILANAKTSNTDLYEVLSFPNVKLLDPLSAYAAYSNLFAIFDFVVGNPPFLKVRKDDLPFIG